jgi:hypothetical protein
MYFGITKIYIGRTVGHVFTKPVPRKGTTQKCFSQKCIFYRNSHCCRQAMRGLCSEKMAASMLTHVWQELEHRIDVYRVARGVHIEPL